MHDTTIRFSDELWAQVQEISRRNGTSAAQFVRDATLAHIAIESQVTGLRREVEALLGQLEQRLRRLEETLRRHGVR